MADDRDDDINEHPQISSNKNLCSCCFDLRLTIRKDVSELLHKFVINMQQMFENKFEALDEKFQIAWMNCNSSFLMDQGSSNVNNFIPSTKKRKIGSIADNLLMNKEPCERNEKDDSYDTNLNQLDVICRNDNRDQQYSCCNFYSSDNPNSSLASTNDEEILISLKVEPQDVEQVNDDATRFNKGTLASFEENGDIGTLKSSADIYCCSTNSEQSLLTADIGDPKELHKFDCNDHCHDELNVAKNLNLFVSSEEQQQCFDSLPVVPFNENATAVNNSNFFVIAKPSVTATHSGSLFVYGKEVMESTTHRNSASLCQSSFHGLTKDATLQDDSFDMSNDAHDVLCIDQDEENEFNATDDADESSLYSDRPAELCDSKFPAKLWNIVNQDCSGSIQWNENGNGFIVHHSQFQNIYLDSGRFKTNKITSFIRQLNLYGFRKTRKSIFDPEDPGSGCCQYEHPDYREYRHPFFKRDRPDLLKRVKRDNINKRCVAGHLCCVGVGGGTCIHSVDPNQPHITRRRRRRGPSKNGALNAHKIDDKSINKPVAVEFKQGRNSE